MKPADLARVSQLAATSYPDHPEGDAIFSERLDLFPDGCWALEHNNDVAGYSICHPYVFGKPVTLDTTLGALPQDADVLYLHDMTIEASLRGRGIAGAAVARAKRLARNLAFEMITLVAVNDSLPFWQRHGFLGLEDAALKGPLTGYVGDRVYMVCDVSCRS